MRFAKSSNGLQKMRCGLWAEILIKRGMKCVDLVSVVGVAWENVECKQERSAHMALDFGRAARAGLASGR